MKSGLVATFRLLPASLKTIFYHQITIKSKFLGVNGQKSPHLHHGTIIPLYMS